MLLKGCDNGLTLNWWTFVILLVHWSAKLCRAAQHLNDHLRKVLAIPVALSCELLIWNRSTNIYLVYSRLHTTRYGQTHLLDVEIKSLFNRPDNLSFFLFFLGEKRLFIQVLPSIFPNTWSFNYLYKTKSKLIFTKCVVCSLKNIC